MESLAATVRLSLRGAPSTKPRAGFGDEAIPAFGQRLLRCARNGILTMGQVMDVLFHNQALPQIEVDPKTYVVKADGQILTCEPVSVLPLAQRYFLF